MVRAAEGATGLRQERDDSVDVARSATSGGPVGVSALRALVARSANARARTLPISDAARRRHRLHQLAKLCRAGVEAGRQHRAARLEVDQLLLRLDEALVLV